jgi:hypothetical protein
MGRRPSWLSSRRRSRRVAGDVLAADGAAVNLRGHHRDRASDRGVAEVRARAVHAAFGATRVSVTKAHTPKAE